MNQFIAETAANLEAEMDGAQSQVESLRVALSATNQQLVDVHANYSAARQTALAQAARASERCKILQVRPQPWTSGHDHSFDCMAPCA